MSRVIVDAVEPIIDRELPVLQDGSGFVRLVDYTGGDERVLQAARVCFRGGDNESEGRVKDQALIRQLLESDPPHWSPFEQVLTRWHCRMPIFVARQWVRHRTARLNELSGRYSILSDRYPDKADFYLPDEEHTRSKAAPGVVRSVLENSCRDAFKKYERLVALGTAKELARAVLPLSTYTEWYWNIDLHNLFNFFRLRLDSHAQLEMRRYAYTMSWVVQKLVPISWGAFYEYHLSRSNVIKEEMYDEVWAQLNKEEGTLHEELYNCGGARD